MAEDDEIVKLFYELGNSPTLVIRYLKKHVSETVPYSKQIRHIVNNFHVYGKVLDRQHGNDGHPGTSPVR